MNGLPNVVERIRRARNQGLPMREIADRLGISESTVRRISKAHGIECPFELRGRWRYGRKGVTVAQLRAHARPDRLASLLRKHGYDPRSASLTSEVREFWLLRDPSLRSA